MAGDTYLTIAGNLTAAPKSGASSSGSTWARLRVASTARVFDRGESAWRDGDTVFMDVVCWRRLAENVVASLQRGDRVLVSGRVHQRSYQDDQGGKHTIVELEAESIGPDLVRHPARLLRPAPAAERSETAEGPQTPAAGSLNAAAEPEPEGAAV